MVYEIISEPQPPEKGFSSTVTNLPVFLTDSTIASLSQGINVSRSMSSDDAEISLLAFFIDSTVEPSPTIVTYQTNYWTYPKPHKFNESEEGIY